MQLLGTCSLQWIHSTLLWSKTSGLWLRIHNKEILTFYRLQDYYKSHLFTLFALTKVICWLEECVGNIIFQRNVAITKVNEKNKEFWVFASGILCLCKCQMQTNLEDSIEALSWTCCSLLRNTDKIIVILYADLFPYNPTQIWGTYNISVI